MILTRMYPTIIPMRIEEKLVKPFCSMLQYNDHDQNYKAYEKVFKRTVILLRSFRHQKS